MLELRRERGEPLTLGLLQGYVQNEGDAWAYTLDALGRYFEVALSETRDGGDERIPVPSRGLVDLSRRPLPDDVHDRVGPYVQSAELLGQRTAELHLALASRPRDETFAPEAITSLYQRSLYQSMRTSTRRTFQLLRRQLKSLEPSIRAEAEPLLERESEILERFRILTRSRIAASRIRTHGDYHLGQVLHTGKDFMIIDFEGEPARPLGERRLKRSPLRDVAGMIRSFHYASYAGLFEQVERGVVGDAEHFAHLETWARYWFSWVAATYLRRYRETVGEADFMPEQLEQVRILLEAYLLEKSVYEVGYELDNRPSWLRIPLQGVTEILDRAPPGGLDT